MYISSKNNLINTCFESIKLKKRSLKQSHDSLPNRILRN